MSTTVINCQNKNSDIHRTAAMVYQRKHPEVHREALSRYKNNNPWKVKALSETMYDHEIAYETDKTIALGTLVHKCIYYNALM